MKTVNEFHDECLNGFIAVAQGFGYANSGSRGDDVLRRRAEQSVRELLKYKPLSDAFANDPKTYHYYVNGLAFAMGIVLAILQANAPQKFQERNLIQSIVNDPDTSAHDLAFEAMQHYGMEPGRYNELVQEMFRKFQELYEPYGKVPEARDYAVAAFRAVFMAGCSVLIECFEAKKVALALQ